MEGAKEDRRRNKVKFIPVIINEYGPLAFSANLE